MEKKEYKIICLKSREELKNISSKQLHSMDIIIDERGKLLKNHSHYSNIELAGLTNGFTNLDVINNPENEKYKFLLTKKR